NTETSYKLMEPRSFIAPGALPGANMMFRRAVLEAIDGFDPDMGAGTRFGSEDVEAQNRASFAGWRGLYTPKAVVLHHHGRDGVAATALKRAYSLGNGAFFAKFLLLSDTRPIFLRNWYWAARI